MENGDLGNTFIQPTSQKTRNRGHGNGLSVGVNVIANIHPGQNFRSFPDLIIIEADDKKQNSWTGMSLSL